MTLSVVQSKAITDTTSGSFTTATTAGNTVAVVLTTEMVSNVTIALTGVTLGGSADNFAQAVAVQSGYSGRTMYSAIWVDGNCAGGQTAIALSGTNLNLTPGNDNGFVILEIAGTVVSATLASILDQFTSNSATTGTAVSTGTTAATTQANEIAIGGFAGNDALTSFTSGWTAIQENDGGGVFAAGGYKILTTTGTQAFGCTQASSGPFAGSIITLKAAASGTTSSGSAGTGSLGVSGAGSVSVISTGSVARGALGIAGTVSVPVVATGSVATGSLGVSGTATFPTPVSMTGSVARGTLGVSGSGLVPVVGSGSAGRGTLGVSSSGSVSVISTGSVTTGSLGISGSGVAGSTPITTSGSVHRGSLGITAASPYGSTFDTTPAPAAFLALGADNDVRAELLLGSTWTDVSPYVFQDTTNISRGHPDESTTAAPSTFAATLDNSDGRFSSLNPLSPYYGSIGLNTNIRVSIPEGSTYLRLETDQVSGASCASSSGINAITGSFEIWIDADADNWYTPQVLATKWAATGNERSWALLLPGDGTVQLIISSNGTAQVFAGSGATLPARGRLSIRASYNKTAGTVTFYTGTYCGSWVQFGNVNSPGAPVVFGSTAPVEVGFCSSLEYNEKGFNGKIYAFAAINGAGNPVTSAVAVADFTDVGVGITGWSDTHSNAWTLHGTSSVTDRRYRFYGEVSAWPQSWTPGGNNTRVALTSGGLLRRLGQGNIPVQSPMYRAYVRSAQTLGITPIIYYPCEDGSKSTQIASGVGGAAMTLPQGPPSLSSFSGFVCSASIPTFNGNVWIADVPPYTVNAFGASSGTDAVIRFLLAVPASGGVNTTYVTNIFFTGSTLFRVDVSYGTGGTIQLAGYNSANTQLWTTGYVAFGVNGQILRASVEIRATASNQYSASFATLAVGATTALTFGVTGQTGTVGRVTRISVDQSQTGGLNGTGFGHLSLQSTWDSLGDLGGALNAYISETAGVRFGRLCAEESIAFRCIGLNSDTTPMGPQSIETITQLLQECADADQGLWFEPREFLGFSYRTRASLANQLAFFSLDYNQDHLADALSPTMDDQNVKNDVTVTNTASGSSSRQVLNDGSPLSVTVAGRYDTESTINLANDSQLDSEAGWILRTSTVNEPRYPGINVDLANTALLSLYYAILDADIGDRITVQNPPLWLPPGLVDQLILGAQEKLSRKALYESYNGRPCTPWNVAFADDVVYGRADTDGSALNSAVSSSATTLSVKTLTTGSPLWTTSGADMPFDIAVAGERMTVTAISGSSSPQTFTVTRSVNGVVKAQAANADVRLFIPPAISL